MSKNTVADFAAELKKSPQELLEQLNKAGVAKNDVSDELSESDKVKLRDFLRGDQASTTRKKGPHHSGGGAQKTHVDQARRYGAGCNCASIRAGAALGGYG